LKTILACDQASVQPGEEVALTRSQIFAASAEVPECSFFLQYAFDNGAHRTRAIDQIIRVLATPSTVLGYESLFASTLDAVAESALLSGAMECLMWTLQQPRATLSQALKLSDSVKHSLVVLEKGFTLLPQFRSSDFFFAWLNRRADSLSDTSVSVVTTVVSLLVSICVVIKSLPLLKRACVGEIAQLVRTVLDPVISSLIAHAASEILVSAKQTDSESKASAFALLQAVGHLHLLDMPLETFFGESLGFVACINTSFAEDFFADSLCTHLGQTCTGNMAETVSTILSLKNLAFEALDRGFGALFLAKAAVLDAPDCAKSQVIGTFRINTGAPALCVRNVPRIDNAFVIGCLPPETVFDVIEEFVVEGNFPVYRLAAGGWVGPLAAVVQRVDVASGTHDARLQSKKGFEQWACIKCHRLRQNAAANFCTDCVTEMTEKHSPVWQCSACLTDNNCERFVCSVCEKARCLLSGTAPQLGYRRCMAFSCKMASKLACENFVGSIATAAPCEFCGCALRWHLAVLMSAKGDGSAVSSAVQPFFTAPAVSTNTNVCVDQVLSPFRSLYLLVIKQIAAIVAGTTLPPRPPIDLALYVVGAINVALDTLSPENVFALVSKGAPDGDRESAFLTNLADLAILVTDRDRLEVLLINVFILFFSYCLLDFDA
jgi:hypothetical protein